MTEPKLIVDIDTAAIGNEVARAEKALKHIQEFREYLGSYSADPITAEVERNIVHAVDMVMCDRIHQLLTNK